jgi:hypothetical protein
MERDGLPSLSFCVILFSNNIEEVSLCKTSVCNSISTARKGTWAVTFSCPVTPAAVNPSLPISIIPFTSPIVMMARIPSGIPAWEVALSIVLLYATFVVMVWLAGKVYRVGIFMHGKKPSFKDLWRWIRY